MESTRPVLKQRSSKLGQQTSAPTASTSQVAKNLESPSNRDAAAKMLNDSSPSPQPPTTKPPKLALIPLRSAASTKNSKQQQQVQKPLEAKQFPIVLGRTNLSQWWYQSCDCQQYYCRLHCRPVAKNIGSLSKVMIQIDTKGTARIVGKNPHLVTITSPERCSIVTNNNNDNREENINIEQKDNTEKFEDENKEEEQKPIVLRHRDILSIGRRDREPWMRFQVVENIATTNAVSSANANTHAKHLHQIAGKRIARETTMGAGEAAATKEGRPQASRQRQPENTTNDGKTKTQPGVVANATSSPQQRKTHHDAELPEWITTTTTMNTASGKRNRLSSSSHNYGTMDTKEQQHHQAMVATLTKAAAAAGAAADADERNKSKKHYRYNSYYNYYNQSNNNNNEADPNAAQRKRRRHNTSSFAPHHHGLSSSHNNKSLIRSAEDLFYNGSSRRGGRLQGQHNEPQIHLLFQDYETSARLIHAGTRRGRSSMKLAKEMDSNGGGSNNDMNKNDPSHYSTTIIRRKQGRTDRNFIGKPKEETTATNISTANASATACNANSTASANGVCDGEKAQNHQSNSMGLLSKNYAAALREVSAPSMAASAEVDETAMDDMPPPVELPED